MFYKEIRALSKALNKNKYLKSFSISLFAFFTTAVFCTLPLGFKALLDFLFSETDTNGAYKQIHSIAVCLFMLLITFIATMFYSSVFMGKRAWYSGRLTKRKLCFKRLIFWFKPANSIKALRMNITISTLKTLWCLLFIFPSTVAFMSAVTLAFTGGIEVYLFFSLLAGGVILLLTGLIFTFIVTQRYFLAPYLLAENPRLGTLTAIKQSKNLTEGQIFTIVRFKLSFLPSFLLYPLIFPAVFLQPHYNQSCCIIAKDLRL